MRVSLLLALLCVPAFHTLISSGNSPCGTGCYMPSFVIGTLDGTAQTGDDTAPVSSDSAEINRYGTGSLWAPIELAFAEGATNTRDKAVATNQLTADQIEAGWIKLFDGKTLFGWQPNNDINWSVAGGVIQADKGDPGLLLTTVPFADYELRCDYRLEPGGNSGIFLRSQFEPGSIKTDCYELNMCDTHESFPTGSLVGRKQAETRVSGEGSWQSFLVTVNGPRVQVTLDGTPVLDYTDPNPTPRTGLIGLQKNAGKIEFRNVFLRPLGTKPLFDGKELTGWQLVPGSNSKFEVQDGTIHVTGGRGYLETTETFGDFVLQADVISNGPHLNSGIFFRALKGTEKNPSDGYELQIQNGFKDGDRTRPMDYGTGAIMHRSPARVVIPDDHEWFTMTLVTDGPHFATWVNGHQVADWTDKRSADDNPRKGKRLKPGHLSLQGHDDTTDLAFKNLRIATP